MSGPLVESRSSEVRQLRRGVFGFGAHSGSDTTARVGKRREAQSALRRSQGVVKVTRCLGHCYSEFALLAKPSANGFSSGLEWAGNMDAFTAIRDLQVASRRHFGFVNQRQALKRPHHIEIRDLSRSYQRRAGAVRPSRTRFLGPSFMTETRRLNRQGNAGSSWRRPQNRKACQPHQDCRRRKSLGRS
jgi:hypothetical protein